jgi:hypothetical protein
MKRSNMESGRRLAIAIGSLGVVLYTAPENLGAFDAPPIDFVQCYEWGDGSRADCFFVYDPATWHETRHYSNNSSYPCVALEIHEGQYDGFGINAASVACCNNGAYVGYIQYPLNDPPEDPTELGPWCLVG